MYLFSPILPYNKYILPKISCNAGNEEENSPFLDQKGTITSGLLS